MLTFAISDLATEEYKRVLPDLYFRSDKAVRVTTGLHKLLSQATFLLLTRQGSIVGYPNLGTNILDQLATVNRTDSSSIDRIVSESARDILDQLRQLNAKVPDDEKVASLVMGQTAFSDDGHLQVKVELRSAAGEAAVYTIDLITSGI